jgi:hypothetical protein
MASAPPSCTLGYGRAQVADLCVCFSGVAIWLEGLRGTLGFPCEKCVKNFTRTPNQWLLEDGQLRKVAAFRVFVEPLGCVFSVFVGTFEGVRELLRYLETVCHSGALLNFFGLVPGSLKRFFSSPP